MDNKTATTPEEGKKQSVKTKKNLTKEIAYTGLAAAILCVLAPLSIPIGPVPLTLATLAVFFVSASLGWKKGTIAVIVYILLGLTGLPVFSSFNGGVGVVAGPTGGYIVGYIPCAFLTGLLVDLFGKHKFVYPLAMVAGLAACYLFGTIWFSISQQVTFVAALSTCVVPFLVFDSIKIVAASALSIIIRGIVFKK
ncbi:MAG TPA: biotin transporter BioY [Clostridiales bacterium]|nr:biotin transporter BioY [Clostridiales bacterium]